MADRTTSHAKEVKMDSYNASLLERYGVAKNDFNNVRDPMINQQNKDMNREKIEAQGRDSNMVKEDMPKLEPKPPKDITKEQDNKTFNDKWQREQTEAAKDQRAKDLMDRYKDSDSANKKDDRGRDNNFENSR